MWIAKDLDGVICAYENEPVYAESSWYIDSGYYFEIPFDVVRELLGRSLNYEEKIEVELKKV